MSGNLWRSRALALAAVVFLTATGCSTDTSSTSDTDTDPAAEAIDVHGDTSNPVNQIAMKAIADLQEYWGKEFPKQYGYTFKPVRRGYYAVIPSQGALLPCGETVDDVEDNAFYNSECDNIAWDAEGLLPDIRKKYGDFVVAVVLAHEWGHAIQQRAHFHGMTVTKELQADCFAGAWARHAAKGPRFTPTATDLKKALAGVLSLRDRPGSVPNNAHGSGFDRVNSYRNGFDNGGKACQKYRDGDPVVTELPWNDADDQASKGNMPYDDIISEAPADLEDFWSHAFPEVVGKQWSPLRPVRPFDPKQPPACGGKTAKEYSLFYCPPPDNYVGFDSVDMMPEIYKRDGDFAVATLIGIEYGLAALNRSGQEDSGKRTWRRAYCLAGGWAASIFNQNRPTARLTLSPGDLDKAVKALILFRGWDDDTQGTAMARVDAYRNGVLHGGESCFSYK